MRFADLWIQLPQRVPRRSRRHPWDAGDSNWLDINGVERAGDGTRTRDVQLGKEAEKQQVNGVRAKSPLKTSCLVRSAPTTSCGLCGRTGPATGPATCQLIASRQHLPSPTARRAKRLSRRPEITTVAKLY